MGVRYREREEKGKKKPRRKKQRKRKAGEAGIYRVGGVNSIKSIYENNIA